MSRPFITMIWRYNSLLARLIPSCKTVHADTVCPVDLLGDEIKWRYPLMCVNLSFVLLTSVTEGIAAHSRSLFGDDDSVAMVSARIRSGGHVPRAMVVRHLTS